MSNGADAMRETGYEIQDTLGRALRDVLGEELDNLNPEDFLKLLKKGHRLASIRRFLVDYRVPAKNPKIADARRVLPNVRRDRTHRETVVSWLCSGIQSDLRFALTHAVILEGHVHEGMRDLSEMIDEFGPVALRLAALSKWGDFSCETLLALIIVDGRLVPGTWEAHLDVLAPLAGEVVAELGADLEAEEEEEFGQAFDEGDLEEIDEVFADIPDSDVPEDPFEAAQGAALTTLRLWQHVGSVFDECMAELRNLEADDIARVASMSVAEDLPSPELAEELRALARSDDPDPAVMAMLHDFAHLCDLAASGSEEMAVFEADQKLRSYPEAERFSALIFFATRGKVALGPARVVDARLAPWLDTSAAALTGTDISGTSDGQTAVAPAGPSNETSPGQLAGESEVSDAGSSVTDPVTEGAAFEPAEETSDVVSEPIEPVDVDDDADADADLALDQVGGPESVTETSAGGGTETGAGDETGAEDSDGQVGIAETVEAEAEAETETSPDAVSPPAPFPPTSSSTPGAGRAPVDEAPENVDSALAAMLASGKWGLAYWLETSLGEPVEAEAMKAVAYADGARSASGPLSALLTEIIANLTPQALSGNRPLQLVALAGAVRAALVAPYCGVADVLTLLASAFADDAPVLAEMARTAHDSALRGVAFDVTARPSDYRDLIQALLAEEALSTLSRQGKTRCRRGDNIWREWIGDGGLVHDLLAPVRDGSTARIDFVSNLVAQVTKESDQVEAVNAADMRHRGIGTHRLEGGCRQSLLSRLREAVLLATQWLELQRSGSQKEASPLDQLAANVRDELNRRRSGLEELLAGWQCGPDIVLAGAARGAQQLFAGSFALIDGIGLPGGEAAPAALLDGELPMTDVPLGPDGAPLHPESVDPGQVAVGASRRWIDAFDARAAAGDHAATAALIAMISAESSAVADAADERRERLLRDGRADIAARVSAMRVRLDSARRSGLLDESDATGLSVAIDDAGRPERLDLGAVSEELDSINTDLDLYATGATEEFRSRLKEAVELKPAVAAAQGRFESLLDAGDVATAEELLLQLEAGVEQPTWFAPTIGFSEFFPSVVAHLQDGVDASLIDAVEHRRVHGPLNFSELSSDAAATRAGALRAWMTVSKGERTANKSQVLAPALRLLGIEFKSERRAELPSSNDRSWLDLTGVTRVGKRLVPAFGSSCGESQRLLLVWKQPGEAMLDWVGQDPSGKPVVVLYFGTMPTEVRRNVANRLRGASSAPVVVVDDAVVAWAASLGQSSFEVTMRATLPFSAVNPYEPGIAGAVPEEMFYGRSSEVPEITRDRGTCLIYGGRRLGKSALLRSAERKFNMAQGQRAIYVDLASRGLRATGKAEAVWDLIRLSLIEKGIAERPNVKRGAPDPYEYAATAIRTWLEASTNRKMLLLLDECDDFFDLDSEADFAQTRRLKDLMEGSNRRFKAVFAGLHQVARFASHPNQPLAHLGQPLAIGPLSPQPAYNLIAQPFNALGWRFESDDLVSRALAFTNYTPILIQEFGMRLINHLHRRDLSTHEPPAVITASDIDEVLDSGPLAHAIADRFKLTLSLDPRYKAIAYILAYQSWLERQDSPSSPVMTAGGLLDECRDWWDPAFGEVSREEFRALLEELAGLGVLSRDSGGSWRVRSSNVLRLLGSQAEIEESLVELVSEEPPKRGLMSAEARRLLPDAGGARSPLSEQVLADLIGSEHNQLRVVLGTEATAAGLVYDALNAAQRCTNSWELVSPTKRGNFSHMISEMSSKGHRVVFVDLRDLLPEAVAAAISQCEKVPSTRGATRSVVILADPSALPSAEQALNESQVVDGAALTLRRYTPAAFRTWAIDVESGFMDEQRRRMAAEVTGGWPVLVHELETAARTHGAAEALYEVSHGLEVHPQQLLDQAGIGQDGPLSDTFATAAEVVGGERVPVDGLAAFLSDDTCTGEQLVRALLAAGVLIETSDGQVSVEPVTLAAWSKAASNKAGMSSS